MEKVAGDFSATLRQGRAVADGRVGGLQSGGEVRLAADRDGQCRLGVLDLHRQQLRRLVPSRFSTPAFQTDGDPLGLPQMRGLSRRARVRPLSIDDSGGLAGSGWASGGGCGTWRARAWMKQREDMEQDEGREMGGTACLLQRLTRVAGPIGAGRVPKTGWRAPGTAIGAADRRSAAAQSGRAGCRRRMLHV